MVWKYIATSDGVLRIYPGIEVVPKDFNPILRPWYAQYDKDRLYYTHMVHFLLCVHVFTQVPTISC